MKNILNRLIRQEKLNRTEAKEVLLNISKQQYNSSQIAAFLTIYMMRVIDLDELLGFRDAMLEMGMAVDLSQFNSIDLCGTGGDGKQTFNVSTLSSFLVASEGINVTKHGNYGVSSVSGSSNVMEQLGIKFSTDINFLTKSLEDTQLCFLHAPLFNPAMKEVAPIRKDLGVKTFFNMIGPMVNPTRPKNQIIGVYDLELARLYNYAYQQTDVNYAIVHSLDGYDEISLTSPCKILSKTKDRILTNKDFGVSYHKAEDIKGGDSVEENIETFLRIISGQGSEAENNTVCANSSIAMSLMNQQPIIENFNKAKENLKSGKALNKLKQVQDFCKKH